MILVILLRFQGFTVNSICNVHIIIVNAGEYFNDAVVPYNILWHKKITIKYLTRRKKFI